MIISKPTMSMNAVTMSTASLPADVFTGSLIHTSQRGGRYGTSHESGERDHREHVRNHLDELRRYQLLALQTDLQRFSGSEQQAPCGDARRIPAAKDRCRERDEAASRGHAVRELMLIQCEIHSAQACDGAG